MIREIIEKHLVPKGKFIFGFADLRGLLPGEYGIYNYGISIAMSLDSSIVKTLMNGPTMEYFRHYNNVNKQLMEISSQISESLKKENINSFPVIPTISVGSEKYRHFLETLSYDISHKMVATRAGLGWIGKTALLVTKEFGPRIRLTSILLEKDPGYTGNPVVKSRCGKCDVCVTKCPAQAASGISWNISIKRDEFFNARACREKCGQLAREILNVNERICGLCISVCPVGR